MNFYVPSLPLIVCLAGQEDADALRGDRREVGPGAHPVRVPDRERCGGTALRTC